MPKTGGGGSAASAPARLAKGQDLPQVHDAWTSEGRRMRFGGFDLDVPSRSLRFGASPVRMRPREFDLLVILARASGNLVTKEEIIRRVWSKQEVSDAALTQCVYRLRRTLAMHEPDVTHISAIPGRGYQFVVPSSPQ